MNLMVCWQVENYCKGDVIDTKSRETNCDQC